MLNANLEFDQIPLSHRRSFNGLYAQKQKIAVGTLLYKFTDWEVFNSYTDTANQLKESVSAFWGTLGDLHDVLAYATQSNKSLLDCIRRRNAVLHNWNGLNSLVIIRLRQDVVGFVGNIGPQTEKGYAEQYMKRRGYTPPIQLWGGASQVYLPGLTRLHVEEIVPSATVLVRDPVPDIVAFLEEYDLV